MLGWLLWIVIDVGWKETLQGSVSLYLMWVFIAAKVRSTEILVTDRRLLYKTGWRNPKIREIRASQIVGFAASPFKNLVGYTALLLRGGESVPLFGVRTDRELIDAISAVANIGTPTAVMSKVKLTYYAVSAFAVACGFGSILYIFGMLLRNNIDIFDNLWSDLNLFIWFMVLGIAVMLVFLSVLCLGLALGYWISMVAVRFILSASEACELLSLGLDFSSKSWDQRLSRRLLPLSERFLSYLYGEVIRAKRPNGTGAID
jgi:hypothetical protein